MPVIAAGLVDAAELHEVRNMVRAASLTPLAVVLASRQRRHLSVRKAWPARSAGRPVPDVFDIPAEPVAEPAMATRVRPAAPQRSS